MDFESRLFYFTKKLITTFAEMRFVLPTIGFLLFIVQDSQGYSRRGFWVHSEDKFVKDSFLKSNIIQRITAATPFQCGLKCRTLYPECQAFYYHKDTKDCIMIETSFVTDRFVIEEKGWQFWASACETGNHCNQDDLYEKYYCVETAHPIKWTLAKAECEDRGGRLMVIENFTIFDRLRSFLETLEPNFVILYLGANDWKEEGRYQYLREDKDVPAEIWAEGKPSGGDTINCLALNRSLDYRLVDVDCVHLYGFICEWEVC